MGYKQAKAIKINVGDSPRDYMIYEESGTLYYMRLADYKENNQQLKNKLDKPSPEEVKWVQSRFFFKAAPVTLASKIEQDKIKKQMGLMENIREDKVRLTETISEVRVLNRAATQWSSKIAAKKNAVKSSRFANSKGSNEETVHGTTSPRATADDESTFSSDSSDSTNRSEGSFVGLRSENSSSTKSKSERPVQLSDINSMEADCDSTVSSSCGRTVTQPLAGDDDDSSHDLWSGISSSGERKYQVLPEVDTNESAFVSSPKRQLPSFSIPPSPPTASTDDLYRELQAIVDILAQLKGNEPQLENVREALNTAIAKTGGKVPPLSQATDTTEAEISPTPKADDIDIAANIRLLKEVEGKLADLLSTHGDTMGDELRNALTELQTVVVQSISAQTTQKFRGDMNAGVQSEHQQISKTPLSDPISSGKEKDTPDDDRTYDSSSTPSA